MKIGDKIEIDGRIGTVSTRPAARSGLILIIFDDATTFMNLFILVTKSWLTSRNHIHPSKTQSEHKNPVGAAW